MKYIPEVVDKILKHIASGLNQDDAAALAGVAESTFYEWRNSKPEFSESLKEALLKRKLRNIEIIMKAAPDKWQAAAWKLEREFPNEFALRAKLEIGGPGGGPIRTETVLSKMSTEALEKLARKLDAALRKG